MKTAGSARASAQESSSSSRSRARSVEAELVGMFRELFIGFSFREQAEEFLVPGMPERLDSGEVEVDHVLEEPLVDEPPRGLVAHLVVFRLEELAEDRDPLIGGVVQDAPFRGAER